MTKRIQRIMNRKILSIITQRTLLLAAVLWLSAAAAIAQPAGTFRADTLSDAVFMRMQGRSYPAGCTIERSQLRLLTLSYCDFNGATKTGQLVCNRAIAQDLIDIFRELYRKHYPIQLISLIDDFDADDERSMQANNTSCFCYRVVSGSKKLSAHARGLAVDLNPLQNPYVKRRSDGTLIVQPSTARPYINRARTFKYKITHRDLAYRLFRKHGFTWGGDWHSLKDYQHFEKNL